MAFDLREQLAPAACELAAPQVGGAARRSRREVRQRVAVVGEPVILERRDQLRREARGVEQPPERVSRPAKWWPSFPERAPGLIPTNKIFGRCR